MMNVVSIIVWDVSPNVLQIGGFTIRWYGLLFSLGFLLGYGFMRFVFRKEDKPGADLDRLFLAVLAGAILGARLGEVLFYNPSYFLAHPLEIVMIWKGGLASHGGVAGICIALLLYTRGRPDQPLLWLLDRISIPAMLGASFIRIGNVFNAEILGAPADVPWAFVFTRVDLVPRHPVQLYEASLYALLFFLLGYLYWKKRFHPPAGLLLGVTLLGAFGGRFFLEFLKVRQAAYSGGFPLSIGQILSIPLVLIGVWLLVRALRKG